VASTRVKDLIDLVLIATTQPIDALALQTAVRSEAARRSLTLPPTVTIPNTAIWAIAYRKLAAQSSATTSYPTLPTRSGSFVRCSTRS